MRVLFDTNVVLDFLFARQPFAAEAVELMRAVYSGQLTGILGATTITTIYYLARKQLGREAAADRMGELLSLFDVASMTKPVLVDALAMASSDFEDAVLEAAGLAIRADAIVTRDPKGFIYARIPVFAPKALLAAMS